MNGSHDLKYVIASTTTACAAGTTVVTSDAVDTAGFEWCQFVVPMGAIVGTAVTSIKVQQCDTTGGSYADLAGTNQAIADTDDDKLFYSTIVRPREQFLKLVLSRATAAATAGGIIAVLGNAGIKPVTQGTNVSGETFFSPAEGTA